MKNGLCHTFCNIRVCSWRQAQAAALDFNKYDGLSPVHAVEDGAAARCVLDMVVQENI